MKLLFPVIVGLMLLVAACSAPASSAPGAGDTASATPAPTPSESAGSPTPGLSGAPAETDPLLAFELVDVRTGATFTLGELAADKPVLVEAMAIWCTTCLSQQREVVAAHGLADFHSVGIDVEPNERPADLASYAEREGFDWRFATADAALVKLLTDAYGFGVTNPPSTPTFVIGTDGRVRALEFGRVRSAQELVAELSAS